MTSRVVFHDLSPRAASFRDDVLRGLGDAPKHLPPKYFYDDVGSALFEGLKV